MIATLYHTMDTHLALSLDQAVRDSLDLYEQLHVSLQVGCLRMGAQRVSAPQLAMHNPTQVVEYRQQVTTTAAGKLARTEACLAQISQTAPPG